jgi:hypothetical protein
MEKKYFTKEEVRIAKNLQQKKYYDKIKKPKLTIDEKEIVRKERLERREKYVKEYYLKNKEKIKERSKEYFINNKEKRLKQNNRRYRERREEDPLYKLTTNIKRNIRGAMTRNNFKKSSRTNKILGCTYEEFKKHIEVQWKPWMNWGNYGVYNGEENYGWDLDHIIPISSAINENGIILLNHYSNFQPLCSYVNRDVKCDNIITINKVNDISSINL